MKLLDQTALERLVCKLCSASKRYKIDAKLESYSCKMVSEEKRQFKELNHRLGVGPEKAGDAPDLRLGASQTLRGIRDLTGQSLNSSTYQMSSMQDQYSPVNSYRSPPPGVASTAGGNSSTTSSSGSGKKRRRQDIVSSSEDGSLTSPTNASALAKTAASSLSVKVFFCLMSTLNSCFGPAYDFLLARSDEFCLEPELWVIKHYIYQFCSIYVDKYEEISGELWQCVDEEIRPRSCIIYSYRPDRLSDPYSFNNLASFNYFFYNRALRRILFFSLRVLNDPPPVNDYDFPDLELSNAFL